jgi:protocatechuate 3,4-dioxygenase, beta subunit
MPLIRRSLIVSGICLLAAPSAALGATPTPRQTRGPFYPTARPADQDADLTRLAGAKGPPKGQAIQVTGRVLNRQGQPIAGAKLDLWQANAAGRYDHPGDTDARAPLDPNFQGSAVVTAGRDGAFRFRTIKPGAYPQDGMTRPPHIHFEISGANARLVTQMYFPGEALNDQDFILRRAGAGSPLIARPIAALSSDPRAQAFSWDVVLDV